jgi:hypothetical protein
MAAITISTNKSNFANDTPCVTLNAGDTLNMRANAAVFNFGAGHVACHCPWRSRRTGAPSSPKAMATRRGNGTPQADANCAHSSSPATMLQLLRSRRIAARLWEARLGLT